MEPFRIALCQVKAHDIDDAEANLANLLRALDEAGAAGAQLVGLPECSYPAYYQRDAEPYARPGVRAFEDVCALFAAKAKRYGYWLAAGMAVPTAGGKLTNSAVVSGPMVHAVASSTRAFSGTSIATGSFPVRTSRCGTWASRRSVS